MDDATLNIIAMMFITAFTPALTEQLKRFQIVDTMAVWINVALAVILFLCLWGLNGSDPEQLSRYFGFAALAAGLSAGSHTAIRNGQRKRWAAQRRSDQHIGGKV